MGNLILVVLIVIAIFAFFIYAMTRNNTVEGQERKAVKDAFKKPFEDLDGFNPDRVIVIHAKFFGVDLKSEQIAFRDREGKFAKFAFEDLVRSELIVNDSEVMEKSSMRTIGGALLGGAVAGGAGAIIGGLSGGGRTKKGLEHLSILIYTKDILYPMYTFDCVDYCDSSVDMSYPELSIQTAKEIMAIISNIIDRCNQKA